MGFKIDSFKQNCGLSSSTSSRVKEERRFILLSQPNISSESNCVPIAESHPKLCSAHFTGSFLGLYLGVKWHQALGNVGCIYIYINADTLIY